MEYKNRIYDNLLRERLELKGAVLIEGAKWCGKTTTGLKASNSVIYMQDADNFDLYTNIANIQPSILLKGDTPRLIDEWQVAPKLWDAVRFEIDKRGKMGQFILTGSSTPTDLDKIVHSGIGRITKMKMRTMSLFESGDSSGEVSLNKLFEKKYDVFGSSNMDIERLAFLTVRGGWPGAINLSEKAALFQAKDYVESLCESDLSRTLKVKVNKNRVRYVLKSYARGIGSQIKYEEMRKDVVSHEALETFGISTFYQYITALRDLFVIEDSPAWNLNFRSKSAIRTTDTRYFVDPSIATAVLGMSPNDLINDLESFGLFFENLVIRDLRVYADSIGGEIFHYRDKDNLECDAVLHLENGSYGLIEIKLGGEKLIEKGVESLNKLERKLVKEGLNGPVFKAVIVGVGPYAYRRKDSVIVIPISCLKD